MPEVPIETEERLQRVLAARGIASRRQAEALIRTGRVRVNGDVVSELGSRVDPRSDAIAVDGKPLRSQRLRYIILNKPSGYITTTRDERGRRTVMDLVPSKERIYPVGRLDRDTEGLLLLTNDGDVAHRVMHPRHALAKEYHVVTNVRPSDQTLNRVRAGVDVDGRRIVPDEFRLLRESRDGLLLKIVIHEGMYHAVRRIMETVGIPVKNLRRVRLGPLTMTGLPSGAARDLTEGERTTLFEALRLQRDDAFIEGTTTNGSGHSKGNRVRPAQSRSLPLPPPSRRDSAKRKSRTSAWASAKGPAPPSSRQRPFEHEDRDPSATRRGPRQPNRASKPANVPSADPPRQGRVGQSGQPKASASKRKLRSTPPVHAGPSSNTQRGRPKGRKEPRRTFWSATPPSGHVSDRGDRSRHSDGASANMPRDRGAAQQPNGRRGRRRAKRSEQDNGTAPTVGATAPFHTTHAGHKRIVKSRRGNKHLKNPARHEGSGSDVRDGTRVEDE